MMKTIWPCAAKRREMITKIKQETTQIIRGEHQFKSIIAIIENYKKKGKAHAKP